MAKARERRSRGMRQPSRCRDQFVQGRPLVAPEELITRAIFVPSRGFPVAGLVAAISGVVAIAAPTAIFPIASLGASAALVLFAGTLSATVDASPTAVGRGSSTSTTIAFSPAAVSFKEYACPVFSSRRQPPLPSSP